MAIYLLYEYSNQIYFYRMIHYPVMIWLIEKMIQYWEYEVDIQTSMKGCSCYTTSDNSEVTLQHDVVVVIVST